MAQDKYGVILDAGSSGTRLYIYKWENPAFTRKHGSSDSLLRVPEIKTKKKWTKKVKPGISSFHDKPKDVGSEYLAPLFRHALKEIPKEDVPHTPLFLLATAGMRLLPETERKQLLDQICTYARNTTAFLLPDCDLHIQVIPGETEGLYGWIAANYLLGSFDDPTFQGDVKHDAHHTYGFLDMGGASAQIAFAPNSTEAKRHADDLKLLRLRRLDGVDMEYRVFVTTWLGFGVNEARKRYVERLGEESSGGSTKELLDPCLPRGLRETLAGEEIMDVSKFKDMVQVVGTGNFTACEEKTYPLLDKDKPCENVPCLLNGIHVPAIDFDTNRFVGVSEYWHTTHAIFEDQYTEKGYDFATYRKRVKEFCEQDWASFGKSVSKWKWGKKVDQEMVKRICFKASWIINVLHEGIGIPRRRIEASTISSHNKTTAVIDAAKKKGFVEPFEPVDVIDDVEVSWTLGRMVLYASSQVTPSAHMYKDALPVGFGDNVFAADGIPKGFQFGGSGAPLSVAKPIHHYGSNYSIDGNFIDTHWHESIWAEGDSAPRRIPGMFLFLIIFGLATFLLLGRERRRRVLGSCLRSAKNRKRKIFGNGSGAVMYERVMEEARSPSFELGSISDDEVESPRSKSYASPTQDPYLANLSGRAGWGGPPESRERLGSITVGWNGGGGPMESRERLGSTTKSRDVSPSRSTARSRSPMPLRTG